MSPEIRRARLEDAPALEALAREAGLCLDVARELGLSHAQLWLVEDEGEPAGFGLAWHLADELEVVDIAVRADKRKRGHGGRVLDRLLTSARERGAQRAFLEVRASNEAAQRLYVSRGFRRVGERPGYYGDGEDAWLFSLEWPASS